MISELHCLNYSLRISEAEILMIVLGEICTICCGSFLKNEIAHTALFRIGTYVMTSHLT
jgi:hypothetical protein